MDWQKQFANDYKPLVVRGAEGMTALRGRTFEGLFFVAEGAFVLAVALPEVFLAGEGELPLGLLVVGVLLLGAGEGRSSFATGSEGRGYSVGV